MPRERYYDDHEPYYQPRRPTTGNGPAWVMAAFMFIGLVAFIGYLLIGMYPKEDASAPAKPTQPRVGNQAPLDVVRRGSAPAQDAAPANPNVAGNDATATALYNAAVAGQQPAAQPTVPPSLLNSNGQPVISGEQQAQMQQSLQLADQERDAAFAAADPAYVASQQRAPDVSAQEVATMTGRNPCAVPHADPHTCDKGLYKPTPVN